MDVAVAGDRGQQLPRPRRPGTVPRRRLLAAPAGRRPGPPRGRRPGRRSARCPGRCRGPSRHRWGRRARPAPRPSRPGPPRRTAIPGRPRPAAGVRGRCGVAGVGVLPVHDPGHGQGPGVHQDVVEAEVAVDEDGPRLGVAHPARPRRTTRAARRRPWTLCPRRRRRSRTLPRRAAGRARRHGTHRGGRRGSRRACRRSARGPGPGVRGPGRRARRGARRPARRAGARSAAGAGRSSRGPRSSSTPGTGTSPETRASSAAWTSWAAGPWSSGPT